MTNLVKEERGFSLIEIVVALVLLSIGILAIAGMQMASVRGNFFSSNISQAALLALDQLETLKNQDITSADLRRGTHTPQAIPGTIFSRGWNVSDVPGTTSISITMTVTWSDPSNHSISLSTIKAP